MARRRKKFDIFSMSFLDTICCAFGAIVLLYMILNAAGSRVFQKDTAAIRAEVMAGAEGAREIGDRAEAIRTGVAMLGPGDVLLVAGKGHETGQIVGDDVLPFDDAEQASVAVAALDGLGA